MKALLIGMVSPLTLCVSGAGRSQGQRLDGGQHERRLSHYFCTTQGTKIEIDLTPSALRASDQQKIRDAEHGAALAIE